MSAKTDRSIRLAAQAVIDAFPVHHAIAEEHPEFFSALLGLRGALAVADREQRERPEVGTTVFAGGRRGTVQDPRHDRDGAIAVLFPGELNFSWCAPGEITPA